ncbi:MAG: AAA family ATPase [Ignavibacteriales bacterium]|nr:AAA family ATPase [Ignavibacteriales bacterium]
MKILELSVGGYKNLRKTKIQFGKSQITAIIAPNNFGKSNLLEGLKFAYDFIHSSAEVRAVMMGNLWAIPINKFLEEENFYFEVVFENINGSTKSLIEYSFEFAWKKIWNFKDQKFYRKVCELKRKGEPKTNSKHI